MKLTIEQKTELKNKYGGRCSYCATQLGERWQKDHFLPVERETRYKRDDEGLVLRDAKRKPLTYTIMLKPENDNYANLMPACHKCNNDKSSMDIESWRVMIKHRITTINKDPKYASYQKAKRFGLVAETDIEVVFWYEMYHKNTHASTDKPNVWDDIRIKEGITCAMKNGHEVFVITNSNTSLWDWDAEAVTIKDQAGQQTPIDYFFFIKHFEPLLLKDFKQAV